MVRSLQKFAKLVSRDVDSQVGRMTRPRYEAFAVLKGTSAVLKGTPRAFAKNIIRNYLNCAGWHVVQPSGDQYGASEVLVAKAPQRNTLVFFLNRVPQVAVWRLSDTEEGARVEIHFRWTKGFKIWASSIFGISSLVFLVGVLTLEPSAPGAVGVTLGDAMRYFPLLTLSLVQLWLWDLRKYREFARHFYSFCHEATGRWPIVSEWFFLPDIFPFLTMTLTAAIVALPGLLHKLGPEVPAFAWLAALLLLACTAYLAVAVVVGPRYSGWDDVAVEGLIGSSYVIYSLIPLMVDSFCRVPAYCTAPVALGMMGLGASLTGYLVWVAIRNLDGLLVRFRTTRNGKTLKRVRRRGGDPDHVSTTPLMVAVWCLSALINAAGTYVALGGVEYCIRGENLILSDMMSRDLEPLLGGVRARTLAGLYAIPYVMVWCVVLVVWPFGAIRIALLKIRHKVPEEVVKTIKEACAESGAKVPLVVVVPEKRMMCEVAPIAVLARVLVFSDSLLHMLPKREFKAVVIHELYHVKRHSWLVLVLNVVATLTLFGTWFLTAAWKTREAEFAADAFAVDVLGKGSKLSKDILIRALVRMAIENSTSGVPTSFASSQALIRLTPAELAEFAAGARLRWAVRLRVAWLVYFGDLALSYVHPTIDERVRRIEALS